jgi:hypothetical protein
MAGLSSGAAGGGASVVAGKSATSNGGSLTLASGQDDRAVKCKQDIEMRSEMFT